VIELESELKTHLLPLRAAFALKFYAGQDGREFVQWIADELTRMIGAPKLTVDLRTDDAEEPRARPLILV
jgi:hypothetical protein